MTLALIFNQALKSNTKSSLCTFYKIFDKTTIKMAIKKAYKITYKIPKAFYNFL